MQPRKFVFFKAKLVDRGIDPQPFAAVCAEEGDRFYLLDNHRDFQRLRTLYLPKTIRIPKPKTDGAIKNWGSEMWEELHRRAQTVDLSDPYAELAWLYGTWSMKLPAFGCACQPHWVDTLRDDPPDLSSNEAYFWWTVVVHNTINRRLAKPVMKAVDAKVRWAA